MGMKSTMQMVNLGLSIFSKVQTMQQRSIRMAEQARKRSIYDTEEMQKSIAFKEKTITVIQKDDTI